MSATPSVSWRTRVAYGFGAVAFGVKDNGFSYLLLFYYDRVLGLPSQLAGAAIFAALLVDSVMDPVVGYFSDNLRSRWGRRHPLMYAAALPVAASYLLLWNPPEGLGTGALFAWLLCSSILVRTLITVYETPSTALVAELTPHYDERTTLLSLRYFFGWWGGLTMAVLAYLVFFPSAGDEGQLAASGYHTYGVVSSILMLAAMLGSSLGTHREIPRLKQPPAGHTLSLRNAVREMRESLLNPSFLALFGGAVSYAMAAGLAAALNIYLNTYFWELSSQQIGWLNLPYFLSAAIALALAPALSRRLGKKRAAIATSISALAMAPLTITLRLLGWFPENGTQALFFALMLLYTIEVVLIVTSTALVSAMVADVVEESELATGRRSEGLFFAARSFAQKSVSGLGLFLSAVLLLAIGFPQGAVAPGQVPPEVVTRLGVTYCISAVALYGLSVFFYSRYRISRASHEDNLRRLAQAGAAQSEA